MNKIPYNISIEQIVRDHFGSYRTIYSGNISENDIDNKILRDTKVGSSADDNIVIDFGWSDNSPYFWVCYNSKNSEDSVSYGRSHAVYTTCSLESLYSFEDLLRFPFVDSVESKNIVRDGCISHEYNINCQNISKEHMEIDNELLVSVISYCLKKRKTGFKKFLYIIVPDTELEYKRYCLSAIASIFNAIPIGLRKQFRIATNAAEENEGMYHILFCKESLYKAKEGQGDGIYLHDSEIPEFMQNEKSANSLEELIRRCVSYPQGSRDSIIDDCYNKMEKKSKDILDIRECDYSDYYEILKLRDVDITPDILREYDDKLSRNLASEQMDMLKEQIYSKLSDVSVLEDNIDKTNMNVKPNTFDDIIELLDSYTHVIRYLREREVHFSKGYLENKICHLKNHFSSSHLGDDRKSSVAQQLELEKAWKTELENNKERFESFFWVDAIADYITQCDENIDNFEEKYKKERLQTWRENIKCAFTVDNIRECCHKVKDTYPKELPDFCNGVMVDLEQSSNGYEDKISSLIEEVQKYNQKTIDSPKLYELCKKEFVGDFQKSVSGSEIEKAVNWISKQFGDEKKALFVCSTAKTVENLFKQGLNGKGRCSQLGNEELWEIVNKLGSYAYSVSDLRSNAQCLIQKNLKNEVNGLTKVDDLSTKNLESLWNSIEKYLRNSEAVAVSVNSVKKLMIETLFKYMKSYSERVDVDFSSKKQEINLIWDFMESKNTVSEEIEAWYDEWTNESKRTERKKQIKEGTNSFLNYLYACRYDADAVESINKKTLCKKVIDHYLNKRGKETQNKRYKNCKKVFGHYLNKRIDIMQPGYSMTSFLNAITFIEKTKIEDVLTNCNHTSNSYASLYCEEFQRFYNKTEIPIVISEKSDVATLANEIRCLSDLTREDDNHVVLKYYDKKKECTINPTCKLLLDVLGDVIFLKTNFIIKTKEKHFWDVKSNDCLKIWNFLIDGKVINEADIHNLEECFEDEAKSIIEYFVSKKRKESLKTKGAIAGIAVLSLILFGSVFGAGYKAASAKAGREPVNAEKVVNPFNDLSSLRDVTSEINNTAEVHSSERDDVETISDTEGDSTIESENISIETGEIPAVSDSDEDTENIRYGKIQNGGMAVRIRAGVGTDTAVIAYASSSDDLILILCDNGFITDEDSVGWQKVRFTSEFIDDEGNIVPEGTEAYVAAKYIMPIE